MAVGVHGLIRATKDLDIVPDPAPANLARLAGVPTKIDAEQLGVGDLAPEEFADDPTDPEQLAEVRVCGLEHLRAMKSAAGRPQDLEDLTRLSRA